MWTFQTRLPEEFRIADDVQEATIVIHNCQREHLFYDQPIVLNLKKF